MNMRLAHRRLPLTVLGGDYSIHQLASRSDASEAALESGFTCLLADGRQTTLICPEAQPIRSMKTSAGWKVFKVNALLDHSLVGILAGIARTLADAQVSIFALSSWETDFILVKKDHFDRARSALEEAGHEVRT